MARKKETRAQRYKKVYRIVKNTYQDTKLSKRAQTWSNERLYNELGIKIGKKTPELRKIKKTRQVYYNRKLAKFRQARLQQVSVKQSKKISQKQYSKQVIKNTAQYEKELKRKYSAGSKKDRADLWAKWSNHSKMIRATKDDNQRTGSFKGRENVRDKFDLPPEIVERAVQRNRDASHVVNGKLVSMGFDDYDKYGFAYEYYKFIYNSEAKAEKLVQPTPFGVESYKQTTRVIES